MNSWSPAWTPGWNSSAESCPTSARQDRKSRRRPLRERSVEVPENLERRPDRFRTELHPSGKGCARAAWDVLTAFSAQHAAKPCVGTACLGLAPSADWLNANCQLLSA